MIRALRRGPTANCRIKTCFAFSWARGGDVAAVAIPVLRHRVLTTFNAEAAGVTSDEVIRRLIKVLAPREELVV